MNTIPKISTHCTEKNLREVSENVTKRARLKNPREDGTMKREVGYVFLPYMQHYLSNL